MALRVLRQVLANAKVRGLTVNDGTVPGPRAAPRAPRDALPRPGARSTCSPTNTVEPYGNLVRLAALTGLRQGELFALGDRNVDLEARTLTVEAGVYAGQLVPVKTRAARRRVDLSGAATRALRAQLVARPAELIRAGVPLPAW